MQLLLSLLLVLADDVRVAFALIFLAALLLFLTAGEEPESRQADFPSARLPSNSPGLDDD